MCGFIVINFYVLMFEKSNEEWNVILYVVKNGNIIILEFFYKNEVNIGYNLVSKKNVLYVVCDNGYLNVC